MTTDPTPLTDDELADARDAVNVLGKYDTPITRRLLATVDAERARADQAEAELAQWRTVPTASPRPRPRTSVEPVCCTCFGSKEISGSDSFGEWQAPCPDCTPEDNNRSTPSI